MVRRVGMSRPDKTDRDDWRDLLESREKLIWEGLPGRGLRFDKRGISQSVFGLLFFSFAAFWLYSVLTMSDNGVGVTKIMPFFSIPFLLAGAYLAVGHWFYDAFARSRTQYVLTDRRAIIVRSIFGRSVKSYNLDASSPVSIEGTGPFSVYFATERRRNKNGYTTIDIGFRFIEDGPEVHELIRKSIRQFA